jgi:hypothetical protein
MKDEGGAAARQIGRAALPTRCRQHVGAGGPPFIIHHSSFTLGEVLSCLARRLSPKLLGSA